MSNLSVQFRLEEQIINCWSLVDEIREITTNGDLSKQEIVDLLEALATVYSRKFERTFSCFEQMNKQMYELKRQLKQNNLSEVETCDLSVDDIPW